MKSKHFSLLFLAAYGLFTGASLSLAAWLHPFEGDLTRIGGKSENVFGWNDAQAVFPANLGTYWAPGQPAYSGEDVVVFGDSFSHMGLGDGRHFGWQNFLSAATGLSVLTFNHGNADIRQWLENQAPGQMPDYVIFERVERGIYENKASEACVFNSQLLPVQLRGLIDASLAGNQLQRPTKNKLEMAAAVHWLRTNARQEGEVHELALTRADLFSNTASDRVLLYEDDFLMDKRRQEELEEAKLACYLEELRQLAEANGRTRFIVAIAPDKTTVYRPFLKNPPAGDNLFERLHQAGVPLIRFDQIFQQQAATGVKDLYLPNDTHWGSEGNRLFASVLTDLLRLSPTVSEERFTSADDR